MDLRCEHKKHGEVLEPGIVEIKCRSSLCGAGPDVVVLHAWDTRTDPPKLLHTTKFKNPGKGQLQCH